MKYLFIILSFSITSLIYAQGDTKQHILFKEVKEKYETEITNQCDTFKSHFNDKEATDRIIFLNKDFSTTLFSKYSSVGYWYCNANDSEDKRMNIGIISILFKNEKDRENAEKKFNLQIGKILKWSC